MRKSLKSILEGKLQPTELQALIKSYDIIGDIAIIRIPERNLSQSRIIAEAVMEAHRHVKTVFRQAGAVSGDFRLRQIEWIVGEKRTTTIHKEHGCIFKVDLEKCYFSPRLSYERMRTARLAQPNETVVNMFAGVGVFSILMAKHSRVRKVYSIDLNPVAVDYMRENISLNRVIAKVKPILGDAKQVIAERLGGIADRVLMPLPERAFEYLEYAIKALTPRGGWVHYYDFEHAPKNENPVEKIKAKVAAKLREFDAQFSILGGRVVRATGPNWYQVGLDIEFLNA